MENVILIIHLLLALALIGIVLMQRSEGGGLGIGGGGGGGMMSARGAATALSKATWMLAGAFIFTSITLTILAAEKSAGSSVVDRLAPAAQDQKADEPLPFALPPSDSTAPLTPKAE